MKKITLLIAVLSIIGCSKDEGSDNPTETNNLKLIKEVVTDYIYDDNETINYIYENGILVRSEKIEDNGDVYKTDYLYENGKLKTENTYLNNIKSGWITYNYTDKLISSKSGSDNGVLYSVTFKYNSLSQMIKTIHYDNKDVLDYEETFEYNNEGNISKHSHSEFSGDLTFQYDNKNNPYSLAYSVEILKIYETGYSKNNIIKKNSNTTYEYIYNDKNYPTEVIEKLNGVPQSKTIFTYQ